MRTFETVPNAGAGYLEALVGVTSAGGPYGLAAAGLRVARNQALYAQLGWTRETQWNAGLGWRLNF